MPLDSDTDSDGEVSYKASPKAKSWSEQKYFGTESPLRKFPNFRVLDNGMRETPPPPPAPHPPDGMSPGSFSTFSFDTSEARSDVGGSRTINQGVLNVQGGGAKDSRAMTANANEETERLRHQVRSSSSNKTDPTKFHSHTPS
jgi:hypothetical protein